MRVALELCNFAVVKRWLAYIAPLLLCACQGNMIRQELHRVDSLNQCDVPLDTITTMDEVVDYLDLWGTPNERMTAHYLRGRIFHDQNNAPMALRYYRDAVGYADTTADDCDYRRLSRIYGQIADLFHQQRAPRLEIEAEQKAIEYAWRAKDTLSAIIFYQFLGNPYHMLNIMDSCLYYNYEAIKLYKKYGYEKIAAGNLPIVFDIHLRKEEYQKAKAVMDEFEREYINPQKENYYAHNPGYYFYLGTYYLGVHKLDSAEYCYRKLLANSHNNDHRESAYKGLKTLYMQLGIGDSISKYADLYCQYNDSASFQHSADELTRTHALYNYEEHERIATKKTQEATRYRQAVFLLIVILSGAGYASYRYFKRQKQKQREELRKVNSTYSTLLSQYHQVNTDLTNSQQNLEIYREEKERELKSLKNRLAEYQFKATVAERWTSEQAMLQNPIVSQLHLLASQVIVPTHAQWQEFREFAEEHLSVFYQHINRCDIGLTNQEIIISILVRLQFIPTEQAALLDVSKQRITNLRSSINQKLFGIKGSKNLEENITTLSLRIS